jgi:Glycosyltransferase family 87
VDQVTRGRAPERIFLAALIALLAILLARSTPRLIGDGAEYLAVADNLSRFQRPSLNYRQRQEARLEFPRLAGPDGRQDVLHFWIYPALAAVPLMIVRALQLEPAVAFAFVNVALLIAAAVFASSRVPWTMSALLFSGPVLWWIDKVHTEVFTFSLLSVGVLLWRDRPFIAAIALGLAATQNPPILFVLACFAIAAMLSKDSRSTRTIALAALTGLAVASIHPLYYWIRLRQFLPLVDATATGGLTTTSYAAVLSDLNIGLLPNDPWIGAALLIAGIMAVRRRVRPTAYQVASIVSVAVLLVIFGQVINLNHGGTPGLSRYALWLLPMTVPWLNVTGAGWSGRALHAVAVCAAVWSVIYFRPSLDEGHLFPTRTAAFVWQRFPSLENPLPEIFSERLRHRENVPARAATGNCAKVLLLGGEGPPDCPVDPIPPRCRTAPCYANRDGSGAYSFVVMRQRRTGSFLF